VAHTIRTAKYFDEDFQNPGFARRWRRIENEGQVNTCIPGFCSLFITNAEEVKSEYLYPGTGSGLLITPQISFVSMYFHLDLDWGKV
jgi:hypothetical protein